MTWLLGLFALVMQPAAADDKASSKNITATLRPFVDRHTLAGAVAWWPTRTRSSVEAVGHADIAAKTLMGPDALFWIASQTKPITAVLLMMLLDEGKLKLDDPVEKYLPELKDLIVAGPDKQIKKPQHPITIREILSHTSGMPFKSAQEHPTLDVLSLKDAVQSYAKTPLLFDPRFVTAS